MDATHVHLMLVHFPIIGTVIGTGILAYGQISGNNSIMKVALTTLALMAILTVPVFLTGEEAEEVIENLPGVSESIIEKHEELAKVAIWFMGTLGVFSLAGLFAIWKKANFSRSIVWVTLITSLITLGMLAKVGNLGGQIRHTEIRATQQVSVIEYFGVQESVKV